MKSEELFAKWYCELNCFRWPKEWGEPSEVIQTGLNMEGRERYEYLNQHGWNDLIEACCQIASEQERKRIWRRGYVTPKLPLDAATGTTSLPTNIV